MKYCQWCKRKIIFMYPNVTRKSHSEKSYYFKTCEVYSKSMGYVSWKININWIKRYFQGKVKRTRFHELLCIAMNILTHKCTKEIKYAILLTTEARSEYKCNFEADYVWIHSFTCLTWYGFNYMISCFRFRHIPLYSTRYYGCSWYVWVLGTQFVFFKCYMSLDYRQFYDRKLHWTNLDSLIYHLALLQRVAQNLSEWWTNLGF